MAQANTMLLFWAKLLSFPAYLLLTRQPTAFISATGSLQQLSQFDTEWREADALLFSRTVTFAPQAFAYAITACMLCHTRKRGIFVTVWPLKSWQFFLVVLFLFVFVLLDTLTALLRMMRKGMAPLPRHKTGLQHIFYVYLSVSVASSYNIDLEHPLVFRGPNSSFFGYSVLEHYHDNTRWWVSCSKVPWKVFISFQWCNEFVLV